jgi:beta-glucosidase
VRVTNAGRVRADEVVQLYISRTDGAALAPIRALKGFRRVTLDPGESQAVTFTLDERALSSVGADGRRVVAPGRLAVSVGGRQPLPERQPGSATSQVATGSVVIAGTAIRVAP